VLISKLNSSASHNKQWTVYHNVQSSNGAFTWKEAITNIIPLEVRSVFVSAMHEHADVCTFYQTSKHCGSACVLFLSGEYPFRISITVPTIPFTLCSSALPAYNHRPIQFTEWVCNGLEFRGYLIWIPAGDLLSWLVLSLFTTQGDGMDCTFT
jgi:hypothetical protein